MKGNRNQNQKAKGKKKLLFDEAGWIVIVYEVFINIFPFCRQLLQIVCKN